MATKKAKNIVIKNLDIVKAQAVNIHDNAMQTTETIVDQSLEMGKDWQKLFAKAMKQGTVLFGKQQEMVLETLESLKGQYLDGGKQLRKLLSLESPIRPLKTPLIAKIEAKRAAAAQQIKTTLNAKPKAAKAKKTVAKKATAVKSTAKKAVKKATPKTTKTATPKTDVILNDLKIIEGIGPKIEGLFHKAGIKTFKKLASTDVKTLREILVQAGPRFKNANPTTWKKQAKLAAAGKMAELNKLQKTIKGGKIVKK